MHGWQLYSAVSLRFIPAAVPTIISIASAQRRYWVASAAAAAAAAAVAAAVAVVVVVVVVSRCSSAVAAHAHSHPQALVAQGLNASGLTCPMAAVGGDPTKCAPLGAQVKQNVGVIQRARAQAPLAPWSCGGPDESDAKKPPS
jgi:hypothetical protein